LSLLDDDQTFEKDLRVWALSVLESRILQQYLNTGGADLPDLYADSLQSEGGDNGKINTSNTSLYYHTDGRMQHLPTNKYYGQRAGMIVDEFNDGSIDTSLWSISEEPYDDFGNGRGVVNEGGGSISLDSTSSDSGGDSYSNPCSVSSDFTTNAITVFRVTNTTVDGNDSGCPGGDSYLRIKVSGTKIAEDHYWKDSDCGYNYESYNGGCAGSWTVVANGQNSGVYKNGSRVQNSPSTGGIKYYAEADTWDSDGKAHMDVEYFQTWNWVDGNLVCDNVESLSNVEAALPQIMAVLPGNTSVSVDISVDGGSTYADHLSGLTPGEIKNIDKHRFDDDVSGDNLTVRFDVDTGNSSETAEVNGAGVMSW